jgi:hypothetical protein
VVGSGGWLYYAGTTDDYVGAAPLTERSLRNIAHNLFLMQTYADAQGARFVFAIAPNKNTLYPEHMPSYYLAAPNASNAERLIPYLEEYGVNYVNLFAALAEGADATGAAEGSATGAAETADSLYLLRDSHWDNRGALIASNALTRELGLTLGTAGLNAALLQPSWILRVDSVGDLDAMLFPGATTPQTQYYLEGINDAGGFSGEYWSYTGEGNSVEADLIQTIGAGEDTLIVYRDSFGNALLPYLAAQTATAEFSKLVPYNALRIADIKPSFVVVERAERHIDYLAQNAPLMPCPTVKLNTSEAKVDTSAQARSTCETGSNGPLVSFSGVVDSRLIDDETQVYVSVQPVEAGEESSERVFEAFMLSPSRTGEGATAIGAAVASGAATANEATEENGYLVYIPQTALPNGESAINVFVAQGGRLLLVQSDRYRSS